MPYLRMFLGEKEIDQILLSDLLLQSVIGQHTIEEEKQHMLSKHDVVIRQSPFQPAFTLDTIPSSINFFTPLKPDR